MPNALYLNRSRESFRPFREKYKEGVAAFSYAGWPPWRAVQRGLKVLMAVGLATLGFGCGGMQA